MVVLLATGGRRSRVGRLGLGRSIGTCRLRLRPARRSGPPRPAQPTGGDRDGGDQPGGGEHGQDLGPAHLGLADPTSRRATTSTAYSDRWLTSEVTVIEIQRWATRSPV